MGQNKQKRKFTSKAVCRQHNAEIPQSMPTYEVRGNYISL